MKRISMLKMKEILRLHYEGKLSNRKISKALNVSHSVVNDYIKEFKNSNKEYWSPFHEGTKCDMRFKSSLI